MGRSVREIKDALKAHGVDFSHVEDKRDLEALLCEAEGREPPPRPEFGGSLKRPLPEVEHRKDWFHEVFGFTETGVSYEDIQSRLRLSTRENRHMVLEGPNGVEYDVGRFSLPSLLELREEGASLGGIAALPGRLHVANVAGDVASMHADPANQHATFQVASQFNCLEFPGPSSTPESGIGRYASDRTQGPACSIACGPATAFRNYCVEVGGHRGQSRARQIANLDGILAALGDAGQFIEVRAGYTLAADEGLRMLNTHLEQLGPAALAELGAELRIGVQEDAQVTSTDWGRQQLRDRRQRVTQVFCSACSVSYSENPRELWAPFAKLVLSAAYEATLWAALGNAVRHHGKDGSRRVFLTRLGGSAFGNSDEWITEAMQDALARFANCGLEVYVVRVGGEVAADMQALEVHYS